MRLTMALLKKKMPNGNIWIGKHRLAHHIYPMNIERMVKRLQVEERNMLLLRHPYLTLEQERGHTAHKGNTFLAEKMIENAASRVRPSVNMEQNFKHLLCSEQWDV